jgi:ectoine hydroxylase-related dioxygenase (phytanoyl-CoA dioxygenase family)
MGRPVQRLEDLRADLAGTHRAGVGAGAQVEPSVVARDLAAVEADGYVILDGLLDEAQLEQIRAAVTPLLGHEGRNAFEGLRTQRLYSVLTKTRTCDALATHPRVLALLDALLLPNYLLSQLQVINIGPGEAAQLEHYDDGLYPLPVPREPLGAATVFALDDFTETNGATVVLPGSHRWDGRAPAEQDVRLPAVMEAGSCVFFLGTLWHGGGANRSDRPRLAVTAQYCQPWLRPQEAFTLSTPPELVARLAPDLQRMLGYSIHPPFVGMVDGMHPLRLLEQHTR